MRRKTEENKGKQMEEKKADRWKERQKEGRKEERKEGWANVREKKNISSLPELNCRFATEESEVRERGQALHNKAGFKYKMAIMG